MTHLKDSVCVWRDFLQRKFNSVARVWHEWWPHDEMPQTGVEHGSTTAEDKTDKEITSHAALRRLTRCSRICRMHFWLQLHPRNIRAQLPRAQSPTQVSAVLRRPYIPGTQFYSWLIRRPPFTSHASVYVPHTLGRNGELPKYFSLTATMHITPSSALRVCRSSQRK
jgi:hypothetical protein